jgi:hypothetical protein
VRSALATLPWVETRTIDASRETKTVHFGINDKRKFNQDQIKAALGPRYSKGLEVVFAP